MTEKNPVGRPEHEPNETSRRQVEMMTAIGIPQDQIAMIIGVSEPTLRKHYPDEILVGFQRANYAVAMNMFRIATFRDRDRIKVKNTDGTTREVEVDSKPNSATVEAAKFWLRMRAGWTDFDPPPPPKPREEKLGKKELAEIESENAAEGTPWSDLVH
jgi:hypothetical protein